MIDVLYAMEETALQSFIEFKSNIDKLRAIATLEQIEQVKSAVRELSLSTGQSFSFDEEEGVAIINVSGTLTPRPEACVSLSDGSQTLYSTIVEATKQANVMASVKKVRYVFATPGGYVSSVEDAALAIRNSEKETEALVTDMAASAGYWLASQCDKVVAQSPLSSFGSIGVLVEVIDRSKMDEEKGIKRYVLTSKNAPEKFPEVGTKEGRNKIIKRLTDIEKVFISRVAEGRGVSTDKVINDFGRGAVFTAEDALSAGMIDKIENSINVISNNPEKPKAESNNIITDFSPAATPGKVNPKKEEGKNMPTLKELLKDNPGAQAEFDKAMDDAVAKGEKNVTARIESASKFLSNDNYPKSISETALKVITGEHDTAVLTAAVAAVDAVRETQSNDDAAGDDKKPDTPAETGEDEEKQAQANYDAKKARMMGGK